MKTLHWTIHDLEFLPDDGNKYEIIDGELYVPKQPVVRVLGCELAHANY